MKKLLPFIWPRNSLKLQSCVFLCFFTVGLGLLVSILAPFQIGRIVDDLRDGQFSWFSIVVYIGLKSLQGDAGLFHSIQNKLWTPIRQHITQDLSIKILSNLHISSVSFHTNRKTGQVQRVMEQGANSVSSLLHQILFQIFPIWANIILVSLFAAYMYAPAFGLLILVTAIFYMNVTMAATEEIAKYDQSMTDLDENARTKAAASLANAETVKCYNAEQFELDRYKDAIKSCQQADRKSSASLNALCLVQNAIITGGLLFGSLWIGYQVSIGQLKSGDFVAFNIFMMQLFTPLHNIGTYYRMVQTNLINMETMLTLLEEDQTHKNRSNAKELQVSQGHVMFDNVTFAYNEHQKSLKGISFSVPKGATVAFVGPSSGGKLAILRLLFRFHDPLSGHIYIDGQDISQVTLSSLRQNIGLMPKDTVIFNESIYYNIHYGNVNADESQVKLAAKAVQLHDKIESFPDGYGTKVGEQGLSLSASDKQRIAIARAILKDAPITLLDTSALDPTTERRTQQALASMTKDRTTLIVTRRLTSVVNADLIFVVKDGIIVEKGSHQELMKKESSSNKGGIYYEMWQKQIHDDSDSDDDYYFENKINSKEIQCQNDSGSSTSTVDDQKSSKCQKTQTRSIHQQSKQQNPNLKHPSRGFSIQVVEVERGKKQNTPKREIQIIEVEEEMYVNRSTASHTVETIEIDEDI
ncbi:hypothetical protein [Parasitella parasitica]|uniref:Uncharacterized protein n=1 Tax=Parasitella parasitica TaxID=35722 RepID=A0A0B7NWW9_9FUNG|nr:hypothetical protein [Parasitella parasitica]